MTGGVRIELQAALAREVLRASARPERRLCRGGAVIRAETSQAAVRDYGFRQPVTMFGAV